MACTFFLGEITTNISSPSDFPESRDLNAPLGSNTTVGQSILEVLTVANRSTTDDTIWFHREDGLWVRISFKNNKITLELGEPAA